MQHTAALTIAIALAAGVIVQALAFHLRIPGIVLLLGTGFLLGPESLDLVRPQLLGSGLLTLVGFAVAVILFEGGMNLKLSRLRKEQIVIRRLVTWGGLVTAVGSGLAAFAILQWDPRMSLLFGTLVMVTGPTVVTPLLRRIHVLPGLQTVLEAEGIIIDAVGAIVAVVTLEIVLEPTGHSLAMGLASLPLRMGTGLMVGLVGGILTALLLRVDRIVPERLGNVFALAMAVATFQVSNSLISESGLVATIVAGLVVGNSHTRILRELMEFKEQLTAMFIGMLFVLLSANLRIADVRSLGVRGLLVVLAMMLLVRPAAVWLCARGTGLNWREKAFLSWLAPRGIVAAAIAALFAETLAGAEIPGGPGLRAMVFLVIVCTVVVQGLPAGIVARLLRVRRSPGPACLLVGANALGRLLAQLLDKDGKGAVLIDVDPEMCEIAKQSGLKVVLGNAVEEVTLRTAGVDDAKLLVAITGNEGINLVCARKAMEEFRVRRSYVGADCRRSGISPEAVNEAGARMLFGAPCDLRAWIALCDGAHLLVERYGLEPRTDQKSLRDVRDGGEMGGAPLYLPLLVRRANRKFVVDERWGPRYRDELWIAIVKDRAKEARSALKLLGWQPLPDPGTSQSK